MAARTPLSTTYDATNPAHRTVSAWRGAGILSWQTNAKHYARVTGEAKVLRTDGSVIRFWVEVGRIRQRTYTRIHVVQGSTGGQA